MSYCRFSEATSEAYIIADVSGNLECIACRITPEGNWYGWFVTHSRQEMIDHVREHKAQGFKVPRRVIQRLKREIEEVGDIYE